MKNLFAFLFGGLFALGLMVSGMSNPAKVLGFLDVFGDWDISLMFVMIGAIAVAIIPFQKAIRHPKTLLGETMLLPNNNQIDQKLMIGAVRYRLGNCRYLSSTCNYFNWTGLFTSLVFYCCNDVWNVYTSRMG